MSVLISGAGGFLGRHLLQQIARDDWGNVIAVSSHPEKLDAFQQMPSITVMSNDAFMESTRDLSDFTLIHLAYVRSHIFDHIRDNCIWTRRLITHCADQGLTRIIHASSQSVYDRHRISPAKETDLVTVDTAYDMGKYFLEHWITDACRLYGMHYMHLRMGSLVGPDFRRRITTRLVEQALDTGAISVHLNGQVMSYTHVNDMVDAILRATSMRDMTGWDATYNVGTDETYTIETLAEILEKALADYGKTINITKIPEAPNGINSSLDATLFRDRTGWRPVIRLPDIIDEAIRLHMGSVM
ncbi:MAG: NAD-dependent epimerase/dehydratase family protein [Saccharofermentanales bacterium]|jgi:nucleoside-diphosphate-sugar epimerase